MSMQTRYNLKFQHKWKVHCNEMQIQAHGNAEMEYFEFLFLTACTAVNTGGCQELMLQFWCAQ